jgi:hypothetical protein
MVEISHKGFLHVKTMMVYEYTRVRIIVWNSGYGGGHNGGGDVAIGNW